MIDLFIADPQKESFHVKFKAQSQTLYHRSSVDNKHRPAHDDQIDDLKRQVVAHNTQKSQK